LESNRLTGAFKKNNQIKTLLVGCGRMGAGNGSPRRRRQSHAGILSLLPAFDLTIFDSDARSAYSAAKALGVSAVERVYKKDLESYQCAVICSPTRTHFEYLTKFLSAKIPVIICEKPVCARREDISKLQRLRKTGTSRVLVNYSRRFQPYYNELQKRIAHTIREDPLRAVAVRYQRGFLNNATHALDLIQFLAGWDIRGANVCTVQKVNDEFEDDPTVSCHGQWNDAALSIIGLPKVQFSLFEIDFFFGRSAIRLRDRGDTVETARATRGKGYYAPLKTKTLTSGIMQFPLEHLYDRVVQMTKDLRLADNFDESLKLARWSFDTLKRT